MRDKKKQLFNTNGFNDSMKRFHAYKSPILYKYNNSTPILILAKVDSESRCCCRVLTMCK